MSIARASAVRAATPARRVDAAAFSDAQLLADCGDRPELYAEFYRRHSRSVLTYLVRRLGCAQTAADLTSETFARALVARRSYRSEAGSAQQWLFGIARNLVRKYYRRERVSTQYRSRLAVRPAQLSLDDISRVEDMADMPGLRQRIATAMQSLPESQATAVRLRVIEERSYAEVAELLGMKEGAVRVRVSRGLTKLAEMLEDVR